jgi:outer membrane protein assembly factor BamA
MDAGLSYYEPFIGGVDLFALPKGDYRERPDYRKLQSELSVGTHPLLNLTAAGGGGYDRVWGDDASRKVKALAWTEYDGRDHFTNPRRGGWAYVRAEVGVKRFDADGFVTRVPKLEIDGWFFLPTARAQTLGFRLAGAAVSSKRATADEYFPLGGRKNLRGFREEHFLTDRYALATVEYRFLTSGESRVFVFADGAYHRRGEPRLIEGAEGAYGAGFRARTPVGLYGVDYGLAVGVGPLAGMLHVTIEEDF